MVTISAPLAALRVYAALLRTIRPTAGLTRLSFNRLANTLFQRVPVTQTARLPDGLLVTVDLDEYHGRILWLTGSNDWKVSRTACALLRPGDVFLDIGANYCSIGLSARHIVGNGGHVHLFEPQSVLADRVRDAMQVAGVENVTLHQIALYNADGEMELSGPEKHRGMATLVDPSLDSRKRDRKELVQVHDTASYVAPLLEGRPFGVKIDIEGAEPQVLPGLLSLPGLKYVLFEGANNERNLWDFFTARGFTIFGLVRSPVRAVLEHVSDFSEWPIYHDFVAVDLTREAPAGPVNPARIAPLIRQSGGAGLVRGEWVSGVYG